MANISEEEIRKLWRTPSFSGSFSGVRNFQAALHFEKGIQKSREELLHILRKDPNFVLETKKIRKSFPRRPIMVHGVGRLWQADLAFLFPMEDYVGFLLCIDVFSRKIFCALLKSKDAKTVRAAFTTIFKKAGLTPDKLETDKGSEFLASPTQRFFSRQKIYFKIKTGRHKAAFAERAIQLVKTRLYRLMRTLLTRDWPNYLEQVVLAINNSPNSAIGFLRPNDIKRPEDDVKVDEARKKIPEDVSFQEQEIHQEQYERNTTNLQKGDFVHVDFGASVNEKGFDSPNYQIFEIIRVDAGKTPVLYKLIDLNRDPVPGYFYKEQLTQAPEPKDGQTFRVEKVLKRRIRKNKREVYVKYLHYPRKFNQWIPATNVVNSLYE